MEMCRACLSTAGEFTKLDRTIISNYNLLTNITVKTSDGLPQSFCSVCKDAVNFYATFRSKCIETEASLQQIFSKQQVKLEESENMQPQEEEQEVKLEAGYLDDHFEDDFAYNGDNVDEKVKIEIDQPIDPPIKVVNNKTKSIKKKAKTTNKIKKGEPKKPSKSEASTVKQPHRVKKLKYYECGLCPKRFKSKPPLTAHLENHVQKLQCGICGEQCLNWEQLLAHRYNHLTNDEQMMCHLCERRFCNAITQENHYLRDHSGKSLGLACSWCSVVCATRRKLNKHVLNHVIRQFICDHCGKTFNSKSHIATHMMKHYTEKRYVCIPCNKRFTYATGLLLHNRQHHLKGVYCKICTKVCVDSAELDRHNCRHNIICSVCGKMMKHARQLRGHMRSHSSDRPYKCEQCPVAYKTKNALFAHKNRHIGHRPYPCKYCDARFFSQCVLIKHTRIHTGEKPYVCKVCGKAFTGGHNLKVHMKLHNRQHHSKGVYCKICTKVCVDTDELDGHECRRNIVCTVCGKMLQHNGQLINHMRSHTSDRPYKCEQCPATYKSRSALLVHNNRHLGHRPYACKHCDAQFYSHSVLIKHTRIHTGEKPYVCKVCGKAFTGGHNLKVHMKVHGEMLVVSRKEPPANATFAF